MSFETPQGLWNPLNRRCTVCLCHACCVFRTCHPVYFTIKVFGEIKCLLIMNLIMFFCFLSSSSPPSWFEIIFWEGWVWIIIYSFIVVYCDCLRAGRSGDRIPVGARFSAPVQSGPEAHPASCTMGTGSFPGVRCCRGVTLTPHSLLVQRSKIE